MTRRPKYMIYDRDILRIRKGDAQQQRPCACLLRRHGTAFHGTILLEDHAFFSLSVYVGIDALGEDCLRAHFQGELGSSEGKSSRHFATLRRRRKLHEWESDFFGHVILETRTYFVGVFIVRNRAGEQVLQVFLRPVRFMKLEVVRP